MKMILKSRSSIEPAIIAVSVVTSATAHATTLVSYDFTVVNPGVDSVPYTPAASDAADLGTTGYSATSFGIAGSALVAGGGNITNSTSSTSNVSYRTGVHDYPAGQYATYPLSTGLVTFSAAANSTPLTDTVTHSGSFTVAGGQWTDGTVNLSSTKWVGFSVTASADQNIALSALSFNTQFFSVGVGYGTVVYSLDGTTWTALKLANNNTVFTSNASSDGSTWTAISYNLVGLEDLQNVTGTVSFRWYLAGSTTSGNRAFRFDDIKLDGTATAQVPEPAAVSLLALGTLACSKLLTKRPRL